MRDFLMIAGFTAVFMGGTIAQAAEKAPCTCRAPGHVYNLGEEACLQTPQGPRRATCIMTLNVTSWDIGGSPCSVSRLERPGAAVG